MNIAFLLGAGASIPAGYSSTECLTDKVLASTGYFRHTNGNYYLGCDPSGLDDITPVVRKIIQWLYDRNDEYFHTYRNDSVKINYEHLYFLASQIYDDASELQNPAILPTIHKLHSDMTAWPEFTEYRNAHRHEIDDQNGTMFKKFSEEMCKYIETIIKGALTKNPRSTSGHLEIIKKLYDDKTLNLQGIATLAHDTHVETYLHESRIMIANGFSPPIEGHPVRIWRNQFYDEGHVPFLKLHGSVDWERFRLREPKEFENLPSSEIGIREKPYSNDSIYQLNEESKNSSLLLIGTFNKPARYNWRLMLDIHYRFRQILAKTQMLIVCGYSFGDKAINTQLIFWYEAQRNRSIVVIDPCPMNEIIKSARRAVRYILNSCGATRFIEKPIQDLNHDKLIQVLHDLPS